MRLVGVFTKWEIRLLMLAVYLMGLTTGSILCRGTATVKAWQATAEAAWAEKHYYNQQADVMISEAQIKIKEKKHGITAK